VPEIQKVYVRPNVPVGAHLPSTQAPLTFAAFGSTGGNIGCSISGGVARCDVAHRVWAAPAKPRGCQFDWAQGVEIGPTGSAQFVCAGDSALDPEGVVVPNGRDVKVGGVVCQVRVVGVTCFEPDGHGFALSRTGYSTF
jgi:hypothetical protein